MSESEKDIATMEDGATEDDATKDDAATAIERLHREMDAFVSQSGDLYQEYVQQQYQLLQLQQTQVEIEHLRKLNEQNSKTIQVRMMCTLLESLHYLQFCMRVLTFGLLSHSKILHHPNDTEPPSGLGAVAHPSKGFLPCGLDGSGTSFHITAWG
jgi:hypothetical protein